MFLQVRSLSAVRNAASSFVKQRNSHVTNASPGELSATARAATANTTAKENSIQKVKDVELTIDRCHNM